MKIQALKTRKVLPPKDEIWDLLDKISEEMKDEQIVAITSKIISIHEGRCVLKEDVSNKDILIKQESQYYLPRRKAPRRHVIHTITQNSWVSSAGIDGSNAKDHWVLYPKDPFKSAKTIWEYLKGKSGVKNLGLIITDSHSQPLRGGATGFALSYWGFEPLRSYIGKEDIFGHKLKVSRMDIASNLAAAATFTMGEGREQTPIAIISDIEKQIEFTDKKPNVRLHMVGPDEDIFKPFYKIYKKGKNRL